ncbi:MAG TPA: TetR/AcrR family transcriptional regulator, partial [Longimicrobiales bacterium]|nr:TetR/AcrR family transcriptional regulator [Longimicrobiales bacterium]
MTANGVRWKRRPDERPAELLEAALNVFAERGYSATRLEDVASAAGVSKGAIYHYFDGKEDLLRQALQRRIESIAEDVDTKLAERGVPASAKLRFVLRELWRHWVRPEWGCVFTLLVGEVGTQLPALFETWAREGPIRGWSLIEKLIEEGKGTGEFRPDVDAKVAGRLIASGLAWQAVLHIH